MGSENPASMVIKTKRPYKTIAALIGSLLIVASVVGDAPWWKRGLLFLVLASTTFFLVTDLEIDETEISNSHPFIPLLKTKRIAWKHVKSVEIDIKSVLTDGIKNPSTVVFYFRQGGRYLVNFEPSKDEVELLKEFARKNSVEVKLTGLPPI